MVHDRIRVSIDRRVQDEAAEPIAERRDIGAAAGEAGSKRSAGADQHHRFSLNRGRPRAEHEVRVNLLRMQPVASNQEFLDGFGRAKTARKARVVERDVSPGHHVGLHHVVGIRDSRIDVAVDMRERDRARPGQHPFGRVLEEAADELEVVEALPCAKRRSSSRSTS